MFKHLFLDQILSKRYFLGDEEPELEVVIKLGPAFGNCGWDKVKHFVQKDEYVLAHLWFSRQTLAIQTLARKCITLNGVGQEMCHIVPDIIIRVLN